MEAQVLDFINNVLEKNTILVYSVFFISCVLQLVFPPFPSDVILVFQGYVTSYSSSFPYPVVFINAVCGTMLGSIIVYRFGHWKGEAVFNFWIIKRFLDEKQRKKAEGVFKKYGHYAIAISKFIPGVNSIIILLAGIFKIKPRVVILSVLVSVVIHHTLALLLGRFLGNNLDKVKSILKTYNVVIIILLVVLALAYITYRIVKKRRSLLSK